MSKSQLKKELEQLSAEQLRQIITDAYGARKEIRDYFEFFLNPDADKLIERANTQIVKELNRSKWRRSKARVTVIKKVIKDVASLNPGEEYLMGLMMSTLVNIGITDVYLELPQSLMNYSAALIKEYIALADKAELASQAAERIEALLQNDSLRMTYRRHVAGAAGRI